MAEIMARLDRPDLAKPYLKKVLDAKLGPCRVGQVGRPIWPGAVLVAIHPAPVCARGRKTGRDRLRRRQGPARIARTTGRTGQRSRLARRADSRPGRGRPRQGGHSGRRTARGGAGRSGPLRPARPAALCALAHLAPEAAEPLAAWLDSPDPKLVAQLVAVLGEASNRDATLALLAPCRSSESDPAVQAAALRGDRPSPQRRAQRRPKPAAMLVREARRSLGPQATPDDGAQTTVWRFDPKQGKVVAKNFPSDTARAYPGRTIGPRRLGRRPG